MNALDIAMQQLSAGDKVNIEALYNDGIKRIVIDFSVVEFHLPQGCTAAYFPEASGLIASRAISAETKTPSYKEVPVLVSKSNQY